MTSTRTDHSIYISGLRNLGTIEDTAASDLLELHDATGLNLHQAPRLCVFVEDRLARLVGTEVKVDENLA